MFITDASPKMDIGRLFYLNLIQLRAGFATFRLPVFILFTGFGPMQLQCYSQWSEV